MPLVKKTTKGRLSRKQKFMLEWFISLLTDDVVSLYVWDYADYKIVLKDQLWLDW